jgi:thiol-disulfide isomerase/thioredoxin
MRPIATSGSINRRLFLGGAAGAVAAQLGMRPSQAARLPVKGEMPSLGGATGWLNASSLAAADLRGKVVLVEFWTYTCINWLRAQPYVRAWAERYREHGLVVVGVHTPEFPFEEDIENIRRAAKDLRVDYPIAVDSDYAIWRAFRNAYWPAFYFVDAQGRIRHHKFGEGDYERSEAVIQELLTEAGVGGIDGEPVAVNGRGAEAAADWANLASPEAYVGYERAENFLSPGGAVRGKRRLYDAPARLMRNQWALVGDWTLEAGLAASHAAAGRIVHRFHARYLHLVMGAAAANRPVRFRVRIDGAAPGSDHGSDIDAEGAGVAREPRLYQLVRQTGAISDRTFEIEFLEPGIHAYAFTFG